MAFDSQAIQAAAPDPASFKAGQGLVKPAKWPLRATNAASGLIWGECQGSGANPYRVVADTADLGAKCSCPSRKFPCKHAIGLMLMKAAGDSGFVEAELPDWVTEWVGRRRKGSGAAPAPRPAAATANAAPAAPAEAEPAVDPDDPQAIAKAEAAARRKEAAAAKLAEANRLALEGACAELEGWIHDQIRSGLSAFLDDAQGRCRRIAARMADAKAQSLAARIDEAPARLMALPSEERLEGAVKELGKLLLLARAWKAAPEDSELNREMRQAEKRDVLLESAEAPRIFGLWETLAVVVRAQKNGMVAQTSWFLNLDAETPAQRFAMLQDMSHASEKRGGPAFSPGDRFRGEMVFYPARRPLRAVIGTREPGESPEAVWPEAAADPLAEAAERLLAAPWTLDSPILLGPGRYALDPRGRPWWKAASGDLALPLAEAPEAPLMGVRLLNGAGVWNGARLEILSAPAAWGEAA